MSRTDLCPQCGESFTGRTGQIVCSRRCADAWRRTSSVIDCAQCGTPFKVFQSEIEKGRAFCSVSCRAEKKKLRIALTCLHCERMFEVRPARAVVAKYCSWWCFRKATTQLSEDEREYTAHSLYRKNRKIVRERDGFRCVECGSEENVQVHHKVPYRIFRDHSIDNLECLCLTCHVEADKNLRRAA